MSGQAPTKYFSGYRNIWDLSAIADQARPVFYGHGVLARLWPIEQWSIRSISADAKRYVPLLCAAQCVAVRRLGMSLDGQWRAAGIRCHGAGRRLARDRSWADIRELRCPRFAL